MDPEVNKILFTTDLSEGAREVFKHAVYLAEKCHASLTLLHVIEDVVPERSKIALKELMGEEAFDQLGKEQESSAHNILIGKQKEAPIIEQAMRKLSDEITNNSGGSESPIKIDDILVTTGIIEDEILVLAEKSGCDLIVMGYRHHNILADALLPSHVRSVMRRNKRPVYLVPIAEQ